jgi:hypothetical protein
MNARRIGKGQIRTEDQQNNIRQDREITGQSDKKGLKGQLRRFEKMKGKRKVGQAGQKAGRR